MCHLHVISNGEKANKQTLAHSKPSVINSTLKDLISHEENIFKRFFYAKFHWLAPNIWFWLCMLVLYELHLTAFEFSEMAVTNVVFLLWFISRGYFTSTYPTGKMHQLCQNQTEWRHWYHLALKMPSAHCHPPSSRGQARNSTILNFSQELPLLCPLPVSVRVKNWVRIPFNPLNIDLVCVSKMANICIVLVMLWSPQWEHI